MVELSSIKHGETVADLGSGDGRISIAFAKKGGIVTGYELNQNLIYKSNDLARQAKVNQKINIVNEDFWKTDLSKFDIVTVYPMPDILLPLAKKLMKELKAGTRVLTNYYLLPEWKEVTHKNNIYLYIKGN
ncbi:MAG: class I SAM-dependent methyltransferase [Candidatus Levybacteria bacterium]|nr:class I SAM-dependent methyltransferase [Candidatus Levybacteria bacterium]MBP9815098.1 class I SAM-dependent methyltransferase [Candidatus Levybacteria bacterium]